MTKKLTKDEFVIKAKEIHGDKYDYSKVEYVNYQTKVCIICPTHGEFWMRPNNHIHKTNPASCPLCAHRSFKYTTDEFINKAKEIHGNKYDYSKVEYKKKNEKVCIICPEHGEFWQTPDKHINQKQGCPLCSKFHKKSTEEFIKQAKEIHGNKYDYSKVEYINTETKVCIICPTHGEFWQTPHGHLNGRGCFRCREESNVNETLLFNFLTENYEGEIIGQYKDSWLGGQTLDIYIPSKRIGIEYQGIQHFEPVKYFGGVKKYEYTKEKDKEKYEKCKMNGVKLFYFSKEKNLPNDYLDTIYKDENDLLNEIKKHADY